MSMELSMTREQMHSSTSCSALYSHKELSKRCLTRAEGMEKWPNPALGKFLHSTQWLCIVFPVFSPGRE